MQIVDWFSMAGNVATVVFGVTSVVIAVMVHRWSVRAKEAEDRNQSRAKAADQRREAREVRNSFLEAHSRWVSEAPNASKDDSSVIRRGKDLISTLEWAGRDTRDLSATLNLIHGQAFTLTDSNRELAWAERAGTGPDKKWVSGITSGLLDAIKDPVLQHGDFELIDGDFWTEVATTYFDVADEGGPPLELPKAIIEEAISRWLPEEADQDSSPRISALIRYKVIAEHSLAGLFYYKFADGTGQKSRAEKFLISSRTTMSKLVNDFVEQSDELIHAIRHDPKRD